MVGAGGGDDAVVVDGEQHGAVESVVLGQDLGQLRQGLLGAVFLVAADEDDMFPLAGPFGPLDHRARDRQPRDCRGTARKVASATASASRGRSGWQGHQFSAPYPGGFLITLQGGFPRS